MKFTAFALLALGSVLLFGACGSSDEPASISNSNNNNLSAQPKPLYSFEAPASLPNASNPAFLANFNKLAKSKLPCGKNPIPECVFMNKQVVGRVPEYKQYLIDGYRAVQGKRLDFILFWHHSAESGTDQKLKAVADDSYRRVMATVENIHPDLIGLEGCYDERCDEASEFEDTKRIGRDLELTLPTDEQIREIIHRTKPFYWHYQYRQLHPDAVFVGADDYSLHTIDQAYAQELIELGLSSGTGTDFRDMLWHGRSEMAVARMGHLMKERGLHSGAIVMGYWHGEDFKRIAQMLGLNSRIYIAIAPDVLEANEVLTPF